MIKIKDLNVFIIGSGNVAWHLTKALSSNGIEIIGIYSRNQLHGSTIAKEAKIPFFNQLKKIPKTADLYLICISDDAIKSVVQKLPKTILRSKIVAHTSGSKSMENALPDCKKGGVFYPLQTFSKGNKMEYHNIPFCINGTSEKVRNQLMELANKISNSVQIISDKQRKQIHLSAVFINNFVNHLIFTAEDLLINNEISPEILQPLLKETIRKQKKQGAEDAQTGPARRMDVNTMEAHLDLLKKHKTYKALYIAISKSIQHKYNTK